MAVQQGRWGVIIDAGSSGSRLHIYRWKDPARQHKDGDEEPQSLPELKTEDEWTKKIRPGISAFGTHPEDVGQDYLKELVDHALSVIPSSVVSDTPFFLMATAGMRLLPASQQQDVLDRICSYVRNNTRFSLPDCRRQVQVIPGETEGLYGWVAVNYLLGGFDEPEKHDHGKGHNTYGFLDMGGASAQIAFAPNTTETEKHANDLKLVRLRMLNGKASEHRVFTATWLGFGGNQARERYVAALKEMYTGSGETELPDPCMPKGLRTTTNGDLAESASADGDITLVGTGKFKQCLFNTFPLLGEDAPCEDEPCLLNGQHVPAIDFDVNHFVGVGEYWHTTHGVFGGSGDKAYDFDTYQRKVADFCARDWHDIEMSVVQHKKASKQEKEIKHAQEACFRASWLLNVLHGGIGIPRAGVEHSSISELNSSTNAVETSEQSDLLHAFQAVHEIDDVEVSWTLGPVLLYASGQVPPKASALPVGFGSNSKGIPEDFQYSGSNFSLGSQDESSLGDTLDDISETATSSSALGFLFFLILIVLAAFFLIHRERRRPYLGWITSASRRRKKPGSPRRFRDGPLAIANKIFGRGSGGSERMMEEGELAYFELEDADSDDSDHSGASEGSRLGRTSGLATPTMNMDNRFEDIRKPVQGFDHSGLAARTEGRERLVLPQTFNAGRRSRGSSPTRLKSPLLTQYERD